MSRHENLKCKYTIRIQKKCVSRHEYNLMHDKSFYSRQFTWHQNCKCCPRLRPWKTIVRTSSFLSIHFCHFSRRQVLYSDSRNATFSSPLETQSHRHSSRKLILKGTHSKGKRWRVSATGVSHFFVGWITEPKADGFFSSEFQQLDLLAVKTNWSQYQGKGRYYQYKRPSRKVDRQHPCRYRIKRHLVY